MLYRVLFYKDKERKKADQQLTVVKANLPHRGVTPCRGGGAMLVDQYPQWISGRMGFGDPVQIGFKFLNNTPFKGMGEGFEILIGRL